jgi:hypothetical protein
MTPVGGLSFESLREVIEALEPATSELDRVIIWADGSHRLGVARDADGHVEIFLVCNPLEPTDKVVADNLRHQTWTTSTGEPLSANRLVLRGAPHFDGVAAFICTELLENGVASEPEQAFMRSEAVIALALRRATLSNQALVGLAGEVFVLARLIEARPERATQVVGSWFGSGPSSRDLQLGSLGIEVKTTTGPMSVHHIQGLHQIELGRGVNREPETDLFLLSIGIEWLPSGSQSGRSIPDLVEAVVTQLPGQGAREDFLARVKQYGGDAALGYDHLADKESPRYARRFQTAFERLYDLKDERLRLLHSDDVAQAIHVEADSISFRVRLPDKVRGDLNPVTGMPSVLAALQKHY